MKPPGKENVPLNITPNGKMSIKLNADGSTEISSDAGVTLNGMKLNIVSIHNIIDLKSYGVTVIEGRTMHFLEFKNGGIFELTYNSTGKIENCNGQNVRISVQGGDTLIISQML